MYSVVVPLAGDVDLKMVDDFNVTWVLCIVVPLAGDVDLKRQFALYYTWLCLSSLLRGTWI